MNDEVLRYQCLVLAKEVLVYGADAATADGIIQMARRFYEFSMEQQRAAIPHTCGEATF